MGEILGRLVPFFTHRCAIPSLRTCSKSGCYLLENKCSSVFIKILPIILLPALLSTRLRAHSENDLKLEFLLASAAILSCIEQTGIVEDFYDYDYQCEDLGSVWELASYNSSLQIEALSISPYEIEYGVGTAAVSGDIFFSNNLDQECHALANLYIIGAKKTFSFLEPLNCVDKKSELIAQLAMVQKANKLVLIEQSTSQSIDLVSAKSQVLENAQTLDSEALASDFAASLMQNTSYSNLYNLGQALTAIRVGAGLYTVVAAPDGIKAHVFSTLVGEIGGGAFFAYYTSVLGKVCGVIIGTVLGGPGGALVGSTLCGGIFSFAGAYYGSGICRTLGAAIVPCTQRENFDARISTSHVATAFQQHAHRHTV